METETDTLTNISRKMHNGYTLIDKCTKMKNTNALGDNSFVIQNKRYGVGKVIN